MMLMTHQHETVMEKMNFCGTEPLIEETQTCGNNGHNRYNSQGALWQEKSNCTEDKFLFPLKFIIYDAAFFDSAALIY